MVWIGLDDTDSVDKGCTTWEFNLLLSHLESDGYEIKGQPRLVRLWPFAPQRTRGNAALSAEFDIGQDDEKHFQNSLEKWFMERFHSRKSAPLGSNPALCYSKSQLPEQWYWQGVRGFVELENRIKQLHSQLGCRFWTANLDESLEGLRGLIGASSAIAWAGEEDWTFEATAWRMPENIGGIRKVPYELVEKMSLQFPQCIMNRDPNAGKSLIAPRTPCPVLYGIRAETEESANSAHLWLQSHADVENSVAYRVFRSNQATDDHLERITEGVITNSPVEVKGGHSSIQAYSGGRKFTLVAFKQGGEVNSLLKQLNVGDRISWLGLISPDGSIHLEKLVVNSAVPRSLTRPMCSCGGRFARQGVGQPLRCEKCRETSLSYWLGEGFANNSWVEPPFSQMRHLSRPLGREPKR